MIGRLLSKTPNIGAMLTDTISLTTMHAGIKENVIPDGARMTIDVRLLPRTDKDEFIGWAKKRLNDDRIAVREVFFAPSSLSQSTGEFFRAVSATARRDRPRFDYHPDDFHRVYRFPVFSRSRDHIVRPSSGPAHDRGRPDGPRQEREDQRGGAPPRHQVYVPSHRETLRVGRCTGDTWILRLP